jgi:uncharacterized protein YdcH (DUF465 family)
MPKNLKTLENQRSRLFQQLQTLGDFRPGTISVNYRKCGRKNCACARREHPGHGPEFLWNTTQGGKSRAQSLRLGPELEKARRELKNYDRFLRLCNELVAVNEQISRSRPVEQIEDDAELEELKKTLRRRFLPRWPRK